MTALTSTSEVALATSRQSGMDLAAIFDSLETRLASAPVSPATVEATTSTLRTDSPIASAAEALRFLLAGKATATFVSRKTGTRFTFKVAKPKDGDGTFLFISLLTGPDNWANYSYFGYIRRGVYFHGGAKAKVSAEAPGARAFAWAIQKLALGQMPADLEIWHEGKCGRCGRLLTVPSSIASGFGPECEGMV